MLSRMAALAGVANAEGLRLHLRQRSGVHLMLSGLRNANMVEGGGGERSRSLLRRGACVSRTLGAVVLEALGGYGFL